MGIVGIFTGKKKAKAQKKLAREQIASQERIYQMGEVTREAYSQKVQADADIAQQQYQAAEQARFNVTAMLGQPGTYDLPASQRGGMFTMDPSGLGGITADRGGLLTSGRRIDKTGTVRGSDMDFGKTRGKFTGSKDWESSGQILDPTALSQQIAGTSGFRQMSRMVAESEQLQARQGPLWESLNNSITGGIYETAASQQRQMMEQLSRDMAKGGTARRAGLQMAQAMRMQEDVNRQRSTQLWKSRLELEKWTKENAMNVQNMSTAWVNNHAGIRDTYSTALTNMTTFWSKTMPANLISAQATTQQQMANNTFNASQNLMKAIDTKYDSLTNGINGTISGIMNPMGGMMGG